MQPANRYRRIRRTTFTSRARRERRNSCCDSRFSVFLLSLVCFVVVVFGFTLVIPAFSQNNATIEGVVTDPSDAAVPGATIELLQLPSDNHPVQAVSSGEGRFQLSAAAGRYRLTITHPSLRRYEEQLALAAGENRELHVQLSLEPLSSSVIVSAAAQPIEVNAASEPVSILTRLEIDKRQITQIAPLLAIGSGRSVWARPGRLAASLRSFSTAAIPTTPRCLSTAFRSMNPAGRSTACAASRLDGHRQNRSDPRSGKRPGRLRRHDRRGRGPHPSRFDAQAAASRRI